MVVASIFVVSAGQQVGRWTVDCGIGVGLIGRTWLIRREVGRQVGEILSQSGSRNVVFAYVVSFGNEMLLGKLGYLME